MSGKIRGMTLLTAAVLAVPLGLWYASVGCAEAEPDVQPGLCGPASRCGDWCIDRARGETCDDGNTIAGDGCNAYCQVESVRDGGDTTPPTDDAGETTPPRDDADTTPPRDDGGGTDTGSCPETPCRLRPSCGCPAGQKCSVNFDLLPGSLEKLCATAGSGSSSSMCTSDDECMAGTVCSVLYSADGTGTTAMCGDYCNGPSDCTGAGSVCVGMLTGGGYPGSCSHACDLVTNAGCPSGTACKPLEISSLGLSLTDCSSDVGTGSAGAACADDLGCRAGTFCADPGTGLVCISFCKVATGVCPGGLTCYPWDTPITFGGTEYGYCM
jgi:cysteine-rich repeat protein